MSRRAVPVHMGSPRFTTAEVGDLVVTHAWFPPSAVLEPHAHDRPTFAVMLNGGFDLAFTSPAIRRRRLPCPTGTILTEPAGEKHANFVVEGGALVVVLQPRLDSERFGDEGARMLDRINHFRHGRIFATARRVAREILAPDDLSPLAIEALAHEMFVDAARIDDADRRPAGTPPWMRQALEYVHENFRRSLRISDVAEAIGVHPSHLADVFRRDNRVPLGAYVRRLRVEWAADRLLESDEPISAIAFQAGFADQAHLTRALKRETGWTPARFRKAHRTNRRAGNRVGRRETSGPDGRRSERPDLSL